MTGPFKYKGVRPGEKVDVHAADVARLEAIGFKRLEPDIIKKAAAPQPRVRRTPTKAEKYKRYGKKAGVRGPKPGEPLPPVVEFVPEPGGSPKPDPVPPPPRDDEE